jgi:hypothetical protein
MMACIERVTYLALRRGLMKKGYLRIAPELRTALLKLLS